MTKYDELLAYLTLEDNEKAELFEEEINIMIHKLKFLPEENFPSVVFLDQKNNFEPLFSESLHEKVTLAGAKLTIDIQAKPHIVVILQSDDSLYSHLPDVLQQDWLQHSIAYLNNRIYIIENTDFDTDLHKYLKESEILAEILQPKYFYFGHEGNGWIKFDIAS